MIDHWSCTCRLPKHFVDLYQDSLKYKCCELSCLPEGTSGAIDGDEKIIYNSLVL